MDILRFTPVSGNYAIIIRTDDESRSWRRFRSRIDADGGNRAGRYCTYTSSDSGVLQLYSHDTGELEQISAVTADRWPDCRPVVFETNRYQICVVFPHVSEKPRVVHARRDIESFFFFDRDSSGDGGRLTGEVDFLNEPGIFSLVFCYRTAGNGCRETFTFEIVSPKLDTRRDYKKIIRDVNYEYENLVFRFLVKTYQQFSNGRISNDVIWVQIFGQVIRSYIRGVQMVLRQPHFRTIRRDDYKHAERIRRWTPELAIRFREAERRDPTRAREADFFASGEYSTTVDTVENRFVKYTLDKTGRRIGSILSALLGGPHGSEISAEKMSELRGYAGELRKLRNNPMFRAVGRFAGMRQESLILQGRAGYSLIYRAWLKLRRGISLYDGLNSIGTLQIWEIYELWCFIKVKRLVMDVMGISADNYADLVEDDKDTMLDPFTRSDVEHVIRLRYPPGSAHDGDEVTLHYQHTYNRFRDEVHTATTEQRPDIVLNIRKKDDITLTYLYDAKYRVLDDDCNEFDPDTNADYPMPDAINQMHRYRDAIYYGSDYSRNESKEIIGGYILFPGRGSDDMVKSRYFHKSISEVNIGAFPLLPDSDHPDNEGSLLREHLADVLQRQDKFRQIGHAIPQRGLFYTRTDPGAAENGASVLTVSVEHSDSTYNLFVSHKADKYLMSAVPAGVNLMDVRYVMPILGGCVDGYYEVKGFSLVKDGQGAGMLFELGGYISLGVQLTDYDAGPGRLVSLRSVREIFSGKH